MRWASARSPTARISRPISAKAHSARWRALVDKPLINLESAINHPCQALADWKTLDELRRAARGKFVLSWAYHPRALPLAVPAATVHMAAHARHGGRGAAARGLRAARGDHGQGAPRRGSSAAARCARPPTGAKRSRARRCSTPRNGATPRSYGDEAADAEARRRTHATGACNEHWFAGARADCRLMHCLPVRRNVARRRCAARRPARRGAAPGLQPPAGTDGRALSDCSSQRSNRRPT